MASKHTQKIKFELHSYITKLLLGTKISKILKQKKKISESHQHTQAHIQSKVFSLKPSMKKIHEAVQALESDTGFCQPSSWSWILLKKLKKNYHRANSTGPICILQIFRNNPNQSMVLSESKNKWRQWSGSAETSLHHRLHKSAYFLRVGMEVHLK